MSCSDLRLLLKLRAEYAFQQGKFTGNKFEITDLRRWTAEWNKIASIWGFELLRNRSSNPVIDKGLTHVATHRKTLSENPDLAGPQTSTLVNDLIDTLNKLDEINKELISKKLDDLTAGTMVLPKPKSTGSIGTGTLSEDKVQITGIRCALGVAQEKETELYYNYMITNKPEKMAHKRRWLEDNNVQGFTEGVIKRKLLEDLAFSICPCCHEPKNLLDGSAKSISRFNPTKMRLGLAQGLQSQDHCMSPHHDCLALCRKCRMNWGRLKHKTSALPQLMLQAIVAFLYKRAMSITDSEVVTKEVLSHIDEHNIIDLNAASVDETWDRVLRVLSHDVRNLDEVPISLFRHYKQLMPWATNTRNKSGQADLTYVSTITLGHSIEQAENWFAERSAEQVHEHLYSINVAEVSNETDPPENGVDLHSDDAQL